MSSPSNPTPTIPAPDSLRNSAEQQEPHTQRGTVAHMYPRPRATYLFDDGESFTQRVARLEAAGKLSNATADQLRGWFSSYMVAAEQNPTISNAELFTEAMFRTLLELSRRCVEQPIAFSPIHARMLAPFDYYKFGFEFASTLMNQEASTVKGQENINFAMKQIIENGDNVVLLSNHQSEGDPYALDMLLRFKAGCDLTVCEDIYYMAGDRVREDPVVMPFSAGRNLLTVYSKKHINDQPNLRDEKMRHNKRTLAQTVDIFNRGKALLWMAPSGGRDRRNKTSGVVELSQFDQAAIDMMKLVALKSNRPVHFFPIAMWSYDMLPPPSTVGGAEIGEDRQANFTPMHLFFGEELVWDDIASDVKDKHERRKAQRDHVQQVVEQGYRDIGGYEF